MKSIPLIAVLASAYLITLPLHTMENTAHPTTEQPTYLQPIENHQPRNNSNLPETDVKKVLCPWSKVATNLSKEYCCECGKHTLCFRTCCVFEDVNREDYTQTNVCCARIPYACCHRVLCTTSCATCEVCDLDPSCYPVLHKTWNQPCIGIADNVCCCMCKLCCDIPCSLPCATLCCTCCAPCICYHECQEAKAYCKKSHYTGTGSGTAKVAPAPAPESMQ